MSRLFKQTYSDRRGKKRESAKWYGEFADHADTTRRLALFTDRRASESALRSIEALVALKQGGERPDRDLERFLDEVPIRILQRLAEWGVVESKRLARTNPIDQQLAEFAKAVKGRGVSERRIATLEQRLSAFLDRMNARRLADITTERIERALSDLESEKAAPHTRRGYVQALGQFVKWAVGRGLLSSNPCAGLGEIRGGVQTERRSLDPEEQRWLLLAAETGDTLSGTHKGRAWSLTGPERALAYLLVLRTGIRRGELLGLVRGDFDLAGDTPTLRLDAERTKARKAAVFHLPKDLAERMREHLRHKATDAPAFSFGDPTKLAGIVRADLQRARDQWLEAAGADAEERIKREKSAFLAPKGVDLHTLRTTYISDLARAGVPLAQAMRLARHSTPHLTAAVYSRFGASDERSALDRLDALHAAPAAPERERATGTDGQPLRLVGDDGEVSGRPAGRFGGEESRRSEKNSASADASTPGGAEAQGEVNTGFAGESGRGGIRTRGTGLGPYAALAKRCLQPLGHPTK